MIDAGEVYCCERETARFTEAMSTLEQNDLITECLYHSSRREHEK
jgi:hypothetical protein